MAGKLGRLLEATIRKRVADDPTSTVDVVIKPRHGEDLEDILQELQSVGGSPLDVAPDAIRCRVPAGQIERLASSRLVAGIRPARVHRMH